MDQKELDKRLEEHKANMYTEIKELHTRDIIKTWMLINKYHGLQNNKENDDKCMCYIDSLYKYCNEFEDFSSCTAYKLSSRKNKEQTIYGDVTVTKTFEFCYGHHLPGYKGKCANFHGHNAKLEIEVSRYKGCGYPGIVCDFSHLSEIIKTNIIDRLDHKNLNDILTDEFLPPTAENTILWIKNQLEKTHLILIRIRLWETSTSYAEWRKK